MESTLEINSVAPEKSSAFPIIAILIYWASTLQYLYSLFFPRKIIRNSGSLHTMPTSLLLGSLVFLLAFGVFKLFLAFKLSRRKNWARVVVMIMSALLAAFLIWMLIFTAINAPEISLLSLLKSNGWNFAEVVAASLLLLPQSRNWFAPKRTHA